MIHPSLAWPSRRFSCSVFHNPIELIQENLLRILSNSCLFLLSQSDIGPTLGISRRLVLAKSLSTTRTIVGSEKHAYLRRRRSAAGAGYAIEPRGRDGELTGGWDADNSMTASQPSVTSLFSSPSG